MTGTGTGGDREEREELERAEREHAVEPGRVREDASPEVREGEREE
ncbi:MAG: hypothetical protein U0237_15205 [Thermoleophilia bacterium]